MGKAPEICYIAAQKFTEGQFKAIDDCHSDDWSCMIATDGTDILVIDKESVKIDAPRNLVHIYRFVIEYVQKEPSLRLLKLIGVLREDGYTSEADYLSAICNPFLMNDVKTVYRQTEPAGITLSLSNCLFIDTPIPPSTIVTMAQLFDIS